MVQRSDVVTATHPTSGGDPPHSPPSMMLSCERLLSIYEYTKMLLNRPNPMKAVANMPWGSVVVYDMAQANIRDAAARAYPKFLALTGGSMRPEGSGLDFVRSIMPSMSRSW